jgi:hypothetical protein
MTKVDTCTANGNIWLKRCFVLPRADTGRGEVFQFLSEYSAFEIYVS